MNYKGIYWHENEVPNYDCSIYIEIIDNLIKRMNYGQYSECRELSLAITKLQEAQLWLTQVSG